MNAKGAIIESFAVGGYRSFGHSIQYFPDLSKINLFIGQNNCGKSNILRLLNEVVPATAPGRAKPINLDALDKHQPSHPDFIFGMAADGVDFGSDDTQDIEDYLGETNEINLRPQIYDSLKKILAAKAQRDGTENAWFEFDNQRAPLLNGWKEALREIGDADLREAWGALTGRQGGSRDRNWFPETVKALSPSWPNASTVLIPAIRSVQIQDFDENDFSGVGLIERLARLQDPGVHEQDDRYKFDKINQFLQNVTGNAEAVINIPHDRATILVRMDGKTLPLESLGTGIHEVIILAAASTVLSNTVVCMEEPEIHLNPVLQRKFVNYLRNSTSNQYFISTHSASLMDCADAEIFHLELRDGQSISSRVTSDSERSTVCEALGYHPSDLLQANCVIWVEGPSDRIYINHWLNSLAPEYLEGIHYAIMFYGGRIASHLSGLDMDVVIDDFILLRRLNRRGMLVIDSDRNKKGGRINKTKARLRDEFNTGPGHSWVTKGREIENYLPRSQVQEALRSVYPSATATSKFSAYENVLRVKTQGGKSTQAPKVKVSRYIAENFSADLSQLDLRVQIKRMVDFIKYSNPEKSR